MSDEPISEDIIRRREELAALIQRHASTYGVHGTAIGPLHFVCSDSPTDLIHTVHKPGLCVVAQGRKEIQLHDERYVYDPLNYLVVSVTLPLAGKVIEASPQEPYLCIRLDLDPLEITQLIADASPMGVPSPPKRGLYLERVNSPILDALLRLIRLLDTPQDIATLAPLAIREIFYRLLHSDQGQRLYAVAFADSQTHRVTRAIDWLNKHYTDTLRIDDLAKRVNLSTSTLHQRFKAVTAMSPLQYQKQLRLQEARRLIISEGFDVSSACFQVGYESPSQFSREYSRLFGIAPSRDSLNPRSIA
ncbi:AraC family transcriptional regulator [Pseudomonas sp. BN102]|uniref:AraC family transcriptional regulator n=1 Tax=Pseudomonas sp. BN102 TaxID=2567886 RepID=UPI002453DBD1|nr:AraC family transcriptional regulator [Pseudomonas sp. BN102]MDH4612643.1 AraC family transcriptional regulator [Pseudomonas sp. BN102]